MLFIVNTYIGKRMPKCHGLKMRQKHCFFPNINKFSLFLQISK